MLNFIFYHFLLVLLTNNVNGRFVEVSIEDRAVQQFSEVDQQIVIEDLLGGADSNGRTSLDRKEHLQLLLNTLLDTEGWLPVRVFAMAVSVNLNIPDIPIKVRGPTSNCHHAPTCLDLACGKCFDPMTSLHSDCGELSYFSCSTMLPKECLPWTCASGSEIQPAFLRNFSPRSAGCGNSQLNLIKSDDTSLPINVQLTGLGLTMNSLTACSEKAVCYDAGCQLCYDPLEQHHGTCPINLSVPACSTLPLACQPIFCWPKNQNQTVQTNAIILRDFQPKDLNKILCF